jgi:hypothetical protein
MNRLILGFAIEMSVLRRYATVISASAVLKDVDVQAMTRSKGNQIQIQRPHGLLDLAASGRRSSLVENARSSQPLWPPAMPEGPVPRPSTDLREPWLDVPLCTQHERSDQPSP